MSHEKPELVVDHLRPRQPIAGSSVAGILQRNPISTRGQRSHDASVQTAHFQQQNAKIRLCICHLSGDMGSGQHESRCCFQIYSWYLFKYSQYRDTATRHADRPKNLSSESGRIHKSLGQSSLLQKVHPVYPTTKCPCACHCRFDDPQSLQDALVQNQSVPEQEDVVGRTGYRWKYPWSITFQRYVSYRQSNY